MGLMDTLKQKLGGHGDKAGEAVDKAAGVADEKTGGKFGGQIQTGADKAKEELGATGEQPGEQPGEPQQPEPPA